MRRILVRLHEWKGQDLSDAVVVRQEHDHAVYAHAPPARGRQAPLEGLAKDLVHHLGLVIALRLLARLLLEAQALVERVVELRVGIHNLLFAHKRLEALAQPRGGAVVLCERRHHLRVAGDEGRVHARALDELTDEPVNHARVCERRGAVDGHLLEDLAQEGVGLLGVQLVAGWEGLARGRLERRHHLDAPPWFRPIDVVRLVVLSGEGRLESACNVLHHSGNHVLSPLHNVVDIRVRLVELAGGKLRVVRQVSVLVAELLAQLVHALEAADDELLEVQFRRHAHKQVLPVCVVEGREGLGRRAAGNLVHHGCLDLEEATIIEKGADVFDDLGARDEDLARGVVDDEIEVTLAKALLRILEPVGKHV